MRAWAVVVAVLVFCAVGTLANYLVFRSNVREIAMAMTALDPSAPVLEPNEAALDYVLSHHMSLFGERNALIIREAFIVLIGVTAFAIGSRKKKPASGPV